MTVTIIGWYGTETIGDRAILAGIISFLPKGTHIRLGSLHPFYTKRTLAEDAELFGQLADGEQVISLFDSRNDKDLDAAIDDSSLVLMGGGPLMHINALYMVEYAFKRASKKGIATLICGCGVGPVHKSRHRNSLANIIKKSTSIIWRDELATNYLAGLNIKADGAQVAPDPSVACLLGYLKQDYYKEQSEPYVALNLRSFPEEYGAGAEDINARLMDYTRQVAEKFSDTQVRLVPMHYFHVGGDDREFMNRIRFAVGADNLEVQQAPLTLLQTMATYQHAAVNIGMRFHSVVFQTILKGNNYILDYTEPGKGKISGFIASVDQDDFYKTRYVNLQEDEPVVGNMTLNGPAFQTNTSILEQKLNVYTETINELT